MSRGPIRDKNMARRPIRDLYKGPIRRQNALETKGDDQSGPIRDKDISREPIRDKDISRGPGIRICPWDESGTRICPEDQSGARIDQSQGKGPIRSKVRSEPREKSQSGAKRSETVGKDQSGARIDQRQWERTNQEQGLIRDSGKGPIRSKARSETVGKDQSGARIDQR